MWCIILQRTETIQTNPKRTKVWPFFPNFPKPPFWKKFCPITNIYEGWDRAVFRRAPPHQACVLYTSFSFIIGYCHISRSSMEDSIEDKMTVVNVWQTQLHKRYANTAQCIFAQYFCSPSQALWQRAIAAYDVGTHIYIPVFFSYLTVAFQGKANLCLGVDVLVRLLPSKPMPTFA